MENRLFDLHVHPSLKIYYLPYLQATLHARMVSGPFWNPLSFRTQYAYLKNSPMKVMLCSHYVIEQEFIKQGMKAAAKGISWMFAPFFFRKLQTADPYKTVKEMMDLLERTIKNTNRMKLGEKKRYFRLLTHQAEIDTLAENEIGMIHAIEGSHALGYAPRKGQSLEDFWEQTKLRLRYLKGRGVSLITLAHFADNMFAPQTNGTEVIPQWGKNTIEEVYDDSVVHMIRATWTFEDRDHLAEKFVRELCTLGIVPDVAHTQEHARKRVYDICEKHGRPVVASHNGLKHFFNHEYNIGDDEILRIHKLGGVIGLILSRRWLVHPALRYKTDGRGIPDLIANMRYIRKLTGDVSAIGIGTDFDGLTDPFKDCYNPSQLDRIVEAMKPEFTADEIDRIFYRNAERVMKAGWD